MGITNVLVLIAGLAGSSVEQPDCDVIWSINTITVQAGMQDEARQYYEAGWLPARQEAMRRGVIEDYLILFQDEGEDTQAKVQLMTAFARGPQYENREDNFMAIFQALEISRPLVPGLTRDEIIAETGGGSSFVPYAGTLKVCD